MPSSSKTPFFFSQGVIYVGDPTQASGAGMVVAGTVRDQTVVTPQATVVHGMVDDTGAIPLKGTGYHDGGAPTASIPLIGYGLDQFVQLLTTATQYNAGTGATPELKDVVGLGKAPSKMDDASYFTLAIVPRDDVESAENGADSKNACWFPWAYCENFGDITYDRPDSDDYLGNYAHTCDINAVYGVKDQADTDIPENMRRGFIGAPGDLGLTWSLPAYVSPATML